MNYPLNNKFSDLDLTFNPHPDTGDLIPLRGDRAIVRSLRNLISTNIHEKVFVPEYGGNINNQLFENYDRQTIHVITTKIKEAIRDREKRVIDVDVQVITPDDRSVGQQNYIGILITYRIIGEVQLKQFSFALNRVR